MILARVVRHAVRRAARRPHPLQGLREAFAHAEALAPRPPPPPIPLPVVAEALAPVIPIRPPSSIPPPLELAPSAWDPEPGSDVELVAQSLVTRPPPPRVYEPRDEELLLQEIQGCKQLLIEIIRRAAYDWVLYRGHTRLVQRALADQAYRWLFVETEGSADYAERMRDGKYITSFEAICEGLDLDPGRVREYIRRLTPKNVTSVGRPAEYRRGAVSRQSDEDVYSLPGGFIADDVDTSDSDDNSGL